MNGGTATLWPETETVTSAFLRDCLDRVETWWRELDAEWLALNAISDPPDWGRLRRYLNDRHAAEREFRRLGQEPPVWP